MTVITALAEATSRVRLIPTVHTLAFNVALVAKMLATLDQSAQGRAGLNVISGWFRDELGQMGLWPEHISHAERYAVAGEWVQALKRLWQPCHRALSPYVERATHACATLALGQIRLV